MTSIGCDFMFCLPPHISSSRAVCNNALAFGVQRTGGFVEQQDRRVLRWRGRWPAAVADRRKVITPRSPTIVSYCLRHLQNKVVRVAAWRRAYDLFKREASGFRRRCYCATVSLNRNVSCVTSLIWPRSEANVTSRMSEDHRSFTTPAVGS